MNCIFGQIVIGPPGSGKTTYCNAMGKFLEKLGRKVAIINIDPANDNMEYKPAVDISDLIKHEEVMKNLNLGPNGAFIYCIEFLSTNFDWLLAKIFEFKDHYLLFDFPGQIELYTHHKAVTEITEKLGGYNIRLCSVNLVDSHHCSDPGKYLSSLMICMTTMLHLGLPHVNIMTKIDEMQKYSDSLHFNIDFYTEVLDLQFLLERLDEGAFTSKYKKLNAALISLIEDYSLVSFLPLDVKNEKLLLKAKNAIDKANGYVFAGEQPQHIESLLSCAVGATSETDKISSVEEYF